MDIKAVLFDMDGVLIEAKEWHYEALNRALSLFGMEISRYDHLITFDGLPTKKKLEMLSQERGLPIALHQFINDLKQRYTMEIIYARCKPCFHHEYAVSRLKIEGFKMAVCSNSIRASVEAMLEKSALLHYMDITISNQDVQFPKPDPEMYVKAISNFGLSPRECLIIEDNEAGIKAAIASGAHVLRVASTDEVNYQNIREEIQRIGLLE